jgi:hypothetical protein
MTTLGEHIGFVAPLYNLALVVIVFIMFLKLFSLKNKKIYLLPWKLIYATILIYIVEEVLTVLNNLSILITPRILNAFFELAIVSIFIYALLAQKEYLKKNA